MRKLLFLTFFACVISVTAQSPYEQMPFSTDDDDFTVWNGDEYVPLFLKGVNLGISKPGTHPGELAASKADYARWLSLIQKAGFNSIRLYTLHYPHFYHVLDSFNTANPNRPVYFFQGIWIEEEIEGYNQDLYSLTSDFIEEMHGNIGAVHGDVTIASRPGKAFGTYESDVSKYLLGYIIGREIHPPEVWTTNDLHEADTDYSGSYFSITSATASETWMTELLDDVVAYEKSTYDMMHPISFSSWPTLDPMRHEGEPNIYEDSVTIDLTKMDMTNAPAGYFASYHAYPYYPDFISNQLDYITEFDYLGQNSYLGYLKDLKSHYANIPLVIAEFGTSSSWGIAHYAHSGIHHGGATERQQGEDYLRMFRNLQEAGIAGAIQFAWIDEWFKRTWINDPTDYNPDRRVLWHNLTSAEQNFGLLGYRKAGPSTSAWESICTPCDMESIEAGADYDFFRLKILLGDPFIPGDTLWVGIDTYADDLGESILPNGDIVSHRAEFSIMLTQDNATLYVTEAYDLFGIWHGTSGPNQQYQSVQIDGGPWKLVRWKNNNTADEVQFIGRLNVNRLNLPLKSTDAVIIKDESIEIRLPWTLLQFVDPSEKKVIHDDRNTSTREEMTSTGIAVDLIWGNQTYSSSSRFSWTDWQFPSDIEEYTKASYDVIANGLETIPSSPIAHSDTYNLNSEAWTVSAAEGVLKNDICFSSSTPQVYMISSTTNGLTQLNTDGSFSYQPIENFTGIDQFTYILRSGLDWSVPVTVNLNVTSPLAVLDRSPEIILFPNPASDRVQFDASEVIQKIELFNSSGQVLISKNTTQKQGELYINDLSNGVYFVRFTMNNEHIIQRLVKY